MSGEGSAELYEIKICKIPGIPRRASSLSGLSLSKCPVQSSRPQDTENQKLAIKGVTHEQRWSASGAQLDISPQVLKIKGFVLLFYVLFSHE